MGGSGRGHFLLGSATKIRTQATDHWRGHTVFGALCVQGSVPPCLVANLGSKLGIKKIIIILASSHTHLARYHLQSLFLGYMMKSSKPPCELAPWLEDTGTGVTSQLHFLVAGSPQDAAGWPQPRSLPQCPYLWNKGDNNKAYLLDFLRTINETIHAERLE